MTQGMLNCAYSIQSDSLLFMRGINGLQWFGMIIGIMLIASAAVLIGVLVKKILGRTKNVRSIKVDDIDTVEELNAVLSDTGFNYDEKQDAFYSLMNAWQREFGYCRMYDEISSAMSMVIHCEPFYFNYAGKQWLIELWKGQYGMTTGAEVGIYASEYVSILEDKDMWYSSVKDEDMLDIYFTLYKDKKPILTRQGLHWWLTGFVLGEFTDPSELAMMVAINFKDLEMRDAFLYAVKSNGYTNKEYAVKGNAVYLRYINPHTNQPLTQDGFIPELAQKNNKMWCDLYHQITDDEGSVIEKLQKLQQEDKQLFRRAMSFGRQLDLFKKGGKLIPKQAKRKFKL